MQSLFKRLAGQVQGDQSMMDSTSRRSFLQKTAVGAGLAGFVHMAAADEEPIQGFDDTETTLQKGKKWEPVSDRKIRMGIVGYGVSQFGAAFGLQNHPNVEVVAVSDLIPERRQGVPVRENVPFARGTGKGRRNRGRFCRDGCAQPCPPLHRRTQPW
jgi:hypothetical protein